MKANSIGSVIPVRKDVSATLSRIPETAFLLAERAVVYIARAAAGRANIMMGKKPVMKTPAVGSPAKKR
ncbi:MAG: hypothetical protein BWY99_01951 [Synergistetes bacterium ADurb.BinA166]|nr:MAG: hypothetical protein BWY99_01951 [Synergistetes bacterium ADurb.BinA166]